MHLSYTTGIQSTIHIINWVLMLFQSCLIPCLVFRKVCSTVQCCEKEILWCLSGACAVPYIASLGQSENANKSLQHGVNHCSEYNCEVGVSWVLWTSKGAGQEMDVQTGRWLWLTNLWLWIRGIHSEYKLLFTCYCFLASSTSKCQYCSAHFCSHSHSALAVLTWKHKELCLFLY